MIMNVWRTLLAAVVVTVVVAVAACTGSTVFHSYRNIQPAGWEKSDTLCFAVPRARQAGKYSETVGIRTNSAFPFMSITLVVEQVVLPGNKIKTDVIKCELTDRNGNVKGDGVGLYQYEFKLTDIYLNRGDSLNIRIRHDMKREILSGISDVGVKIMNNL